MIHPWTQQTLIQLWMLIETCTFCSSLGPHPVGIHTQRRYLPVSSNMAASKSPNEIKFYKENHLCNLYIEKIFQNSAPLSVISNFWINKWIYNGFTACHAYMFYNTRGYQQHHLFTEFQPWASSSGPGGDCWKILAIPQHQKGLLVVWTPLKNMKVNWDD